jgi:hypothetical protein
VSISTPTPRTRAFHPKARSPGPVATPYEFLKPRWLEETRTAKETKETRATQAAWAKYVSVLIAISAYPIRAIGYFCIQAVNTNTVRQGDWVRRPGFGAKGARLRGWRTDAYRSRVIWRQNRMRLARSPWRSQRRFLIARHRLPGPVALVCKEKVFHWHTSVQYESHLANPLLQRPTRPIR